MDITYDTEVDAACLAPADGPSEHQVHPIVPPPENGGIVLDVDARGRLVGTP